MSIVSKRRNIFTTASGNSNSGVQSVNSGIDITVDNTDPANPIINFTGTYQDPITVVANYSALPVASTVTGEFYWCSSSQGTAWLPGSLGGTYYSAGVYYSNGSTWEFMAVPYQATQAEVDTGTNSNKFVTPNTLFNSSKWSNYLTISSAASTYVPYTGATSDVDLGTHILSAQSLQVTGTNGAGHIHLRHQASDATATGQSTALFANSNGDLKYKNDGNYYTTFITSANTADRIYTFPNTSGTVALTSDLSSYVPTSRTITINGTTLDLSANRSWTVTAGITVGTTTITNGTSGRIAFNNSGVYGESANLLWDNTNFNLFTASGQGNAVTTGSSLSGVGLRIGNTTGGLTGASLDFGQNGTIGAWLQSRSGSNYATNYNLMVNPNGGFVLINSTTQTNMSSANGLSQGLYIKSGSSGIGTLTYGVGGLMVETSYNNNLYPALLVSTSGANNAFCVSSAGRVQLGGVNPGAWLHLPAGTAAAGTAPIKLTSGTNLTTPENGTFEFDGINLFFTPSSATRNILAQISGSTALTSGSIPFATTNGYLTSSANLIWDNTNGRLTATNTTTNTSAGYFKNSNSGGVSSSSSNHQILVEDVGARQGSIGVGTAGFFIRNISAPNLQLINGTTTLATFSGTLGSLTVNDVTGSTLSWSNNQIQIATNTIGFRASNTDVGRFSSSGLFLGGTTSPTARLHITAGGSTAGSGPLKLTDSAGTLLATPENGLFEFSNNVLYFTVGGVRKTVTLV